MKRLRSDLEIPRVDSWHCMCCINLGRSLRLPEFPGLAFLKLCPQEVIERITVEVGQVPSTEPDVQEHFGERLL